jgi:hypothetical protein
LSGVTAATTNATTVTAATANVLLLLLLLLLLVPAATAVAIAAVARAAHACIVLIKTMDATSLNIRADFVLGFCNACFACVPMLVMLCRLSG